MPALLLLGKVIDPSSFEPYERKGMRADFLRALELEKARRFAKAAPIFERLIDRYPLLRPYHAYHGARCAYHAKRPRATLRILKQVPSDSVLDAEARLLRADSLRGMGRDGEARETYRAYLERYPKGMRQAEVHFRLGDYRRAYVLGTNTPWARRASRHFDRRTLRASERVERALILLRAARNSAAEVAFSEALSAPGITPAIECTAHFRRAESLFRQRDRARAAPLYDAAAEACEKAENEDLLVRSLYQAGRCLNSQGEHSEAALRFRRVQAAAAHSYADDAMLRESEGCADAGADERAAELLASIPSAYPDGDMLGEAIWRLARGAIVDQRHDDALRHLDRGIAAVPRETDFWAEGRFLYWRGRVLLSSQRREEARARLERCVRNYPLTYYALAAFNRLREQFPTTARVLEKELLRAIPSNPPPLTFTHRSLSTVGFRRAVELIRLGLGREAQRGLVAAGVTAGGKEEDALWLAAVLYDRAGRWSDSHWIPRRTLTGYRLSHPHGRNATRWRLAYPRAYTSLVRREARRGRIPEELLYAVMREESAFNPSIESWANAIGLMQLLVPTAKRFADGTRVTRRTLRRPAVNLKIGSRFLAFLRHRFGETVPLAIAAHNAGAGAVDRWVRRNGQMHLDLFIESILYDQTRRYTKRVLSSYFVYRALRGEAVAPAMPLRRVRALALRK